MNLVEIWFGRELALKKREIEEFREIISENNSGEIKQIKYERV